MRLTIPLGKGIPIEISEEKIPALFEKLVPQLMKHMGDLQTLGVDLTPMVRKMFGAADPSVAPAVAATPAVASADEIAQAKAAGYWMSDIDQKWYPPHLAPKAPATSPSVVQPSLTASKICATCIRGSAVTGSAISMYSQPCSTCAFDPTRPAYTLRPL